MADVLPGYKYLVRPPLVLSDDAANNILTVSNDSSWPFGAPLAWQKSRYVTAAQSVSADSRGRSER